MQPCFDLFGIRFWADAFLLPRKAGDCIKPIGLYIHVPFCDSKCPYCDFYSVPKPSDDLLDEYAAILCEEISLWGPRLSRPADSIYFGGGTPSLLGAERICKILSHARAYFGREQREVTVEINPAAAGRFDFKRLQSGGVNRLSIGLQAANDHELALLSRRHSLADAVSTIEEAQAAGLTNLSLDLMLAIPGQTEQSLFNSIRFCKEMGARHVSAYLLKLEKGTPFFKQRDALSLPDEDETADRYLTACKTLEACGYRQYEISNFAQAGFEGFHNLKYWNGEEYLGLGPSAHSFLGNKRFYAPSSLSQYRHEARCLLEGEGGGEEEYAMLRLRLARGLRHDEYTARFGRPIPDVYLKNARRYQNAGLLVVDDRGIRLTLEGFLVSNQSISTILYDL